MKRGGGFFEGRKGGIIRKMALARNEADWSRPGKRKESLSVPVLLSL